MITFCIVLFIAVIVGLIGIPIIICTVKQDKIVEMILKNEREKRTDIKYEN